MSTVNLTWQIECLSEDQPIRLGSPLPVAISSITQIHQARYSLATATKKTILNLGTAATDDLPDADLIVITSTQDLSVEFVGSSAANNSNLRIKANVPFILGFDDGRVYNAAGDFAGAIQDLTYIRVNNLSGSTASIQVAAFT